MVADRSHRTNDVEHLNQCNYLTLLHFKWQCLFQLAYMYKVNALWQRQTFRCCCVEPHLLLWHVVYVLFFVKTIELMS